MHPHKNRTSTIPIIYDKTLKSNNLQNFSANHNFGYGVTQIHATGYYSGKSRSVIYFVVNRFQIAKLKMIVSAIDTSAFVTISETSDVLGSSLKEKN